MGKGRERTCLVRWEENILGKVAARLAELGVPGRFPRLGFREIVPRQADWHATGPQEEQN